KSEELSKGCKRKTSKIPKKKPVNLLTDWHYSKWRLFIFLPSSSLSLWERVRERVDLSLALSL
ncbi:hypothetical protein NI401_08545, partial [Acinetobacter indicus]|uniref:hypothetical protein n=1 Tax=Acinetobacter indicus TaxID=756892 RepID=UPI00209BAF47